MRILPNDVARCLAVKCRRRHQCKRWLCNSFPKGGGLWYSSFEDEYDVEKGCCPSFIEVEA